MQADVERLIARLLTDATLRARFVADPVGVATANGLSAEEVEAAARVQPQDLLTAARSYEAKRRAKRRTGLRATLLGWLRTRLR